MMRHKKIVTEYRHYSLPFNFPVLLLTGERWRISDQKSGRLHFHNCLEIGLCHTDSGIIEIEDKQLNYKAGDITCIPRHIPHTTYSDQGTESLWSYIFVDPEELFGNIFHDSLRNLESPMLDTQNYQFIMNKEAYSKLYFLVYSIIEEVKEQKPDYQTSVKGLLLSLYVELLRIQYNNSRNITLKEPKQDADNVLVISIALDFIHKNYMKQVSIEELAKLCHLSESHFRRTFHDIIGAAPLDFLNSTRIDEACKLLRSTEASILTVSEQVGFHSISSFNRCFTKLMGTSPRIWRKQTLLSEANSTKASILKFTGWIR
ncbi:MAG TPA: AraC family transcriptional regulator [Mobilitalea sp.]|nr:AraC family transcriptional regulator [Mobilitalea sp.]